MNNKSRTENVIKNMKFAVVCQVLSTLFSFICRTIFIKKLGAEYLGLNGLFTNILTILSFAELGIGDAIIFSMYKPVAEDNKEKIKSLLKENGFIYDGGNDLKGEGVRGKSMDFIYVMDTTDIKE